MLLPGVAALLLLSEACYDDVAMIFAIRCLVADVQRSKCLAVKGSWSISISFGSLFHGHNTIFDSKRDIKIWLVKTASENVSLSVFQRATGRESS